MKPSPTLSFGEVDVIPILTGVFAVDMVDWELLNEDEVRVNGPNARFQQIPAITYAVRRAERILLVDAGRYDLEPDSPFYTAGYVPPPGSAEQLAQRGILPEQVTDVVITHPHFDHINDLVTQDADPLPTFPRANHYLGRADMQELDQLGLQITSKLAARSCLTLVEGRLELGDGFSIRPAPGETGGHQMLRVDLGADEVLYFGGDLYHHPVELEDESRCVPWAGRAAMAASRRRLHREAEDTSVLMFASHLPHAYRLRAGRWHQEMPLFHDVD